MPKKSESSERERLSGPAITKGVTVKGMVGSVLELQHAALLILSAKNGGIVDELNDEVRSLLDTYWKAKS